MDPEGRSRTGIPAVDSCVLYLLSYLGAVPEMLRTPNDLRKLAQMHSAEPAMCEQRGLGQRCSVWV